MRCVFFIFVERLTGDYEDLWQKFGGDSCFELYEEYCKFADGREKMTFIRFSDFNEIASPMLGLCRVSEQESTWCENIKFVT